MVIDKKNWRQNLAESIHESFKHKYFSDIPCAICKQTNTQLAMHVIEYAQKEGEPLPEDFVPMSSSFGTIRGCFPICATCAPPCNQCGLPLPTNKIRIFLEEKKQILTGDVSLSYGNGICREFHFDLFIEAVARNIKTKFKRLKA